MHQFVLEEHLEIMCSEADEEMEEFMLLVRDEFISAMLLMQGANSCRTWRLMIKNAKWKYQIFCYRLMLNVSKIFVSG